MPVAGKQQGGFMRHELVDKSENEMVVNAIYLGLTDPVEAELMTRDELIDLCEPYFDDPRWV
jgi:hypothetical protein